MTNEEFNKLRPFLDDLWGKKDLSMTLPPTSTSEQCPEFRRLRDARLIMGALRYGRLGDPTKPQYDRIASIIKRTQKYVETGNLELLLDIANLCELEWIEGKHPLKHYRSLDDGEHVCVKKGA